MTCVSGPDPAVSVWAPAGGPVPDQGSVQAAAEKSGPGIPGQDLEMSDPASQGRAVPGQVETARVLVAAEWSWDPLNSGSGNSRLRAAVSE